MDARFRLPAHPPVPSPPELSSLVSLVTLHSYTKSHFSVPKTSSFGLFFSVMPDPWQISRSASSQLHDSLSAHRVLHAYLQSLAVSCDISHEASAISSTCLVVWIQQIQHVWVQQGRVNCLHNYPKKSNSFAHLTYYSIFCTYGASSIFKIASYIEYIRLIRRDKRVQDKSIRQLLTAITVILI